MGLAARSAFKTSLEATMQRKYHFTSVSYTHTCLLIIPAYLFRGHSQRGWFRVLYNVIVVFYIGKRKTGHFRVNVFNVGTHYVHIRC